MVIVDEASMVDRPLMYRLVQALDPATHLHLVGDVDQLPSVGPGNVLGDLIACEHIPVLQLTTIFSQAAESLIITNAHRINQGQMPVSAKLGDDRNCDFFLFDKSKPESAAKWVVDIVQNRIPQRFGYDPLEGIQVLSPMRWCSAGVDELNLQLQEALNPPVPSKTDQKIGKRIFRVGDRVMQIRKDYSKGVVNGDGGAGLGNARRCDGRRLRPGGPGDAGRGGRAGRRNWTRLGRCGGTQRRRGGRRYWRWSGQAARGQRAGQGREQRDSDCDG
jgi:exodeoxyribonuclease V alpha subunit